MGNIATLASMPLINSLAHSQKVDGPWEMKVNYASDIAFVNTHTKGDSGYL